MLTEENLPYYFRDSERLFGGEGAWGEWVRRWTAEEGRHSRVIYDYLCVTRALDPVALERARMAQVQCGNVPQPPNALEGLVYVTLQELATRIAHFNPARHINDEAGKAIMRRVAFDENLHFLFYRDVMSATIDMDPSNAVVAIANQVNGFAMPGQGIRDFDAHARAIAEAGIYDLAIHHDQILRPVVLRDWNLPGLTELSGIAEAARDRLMGLIDRIGRVGQRLAERYAEARESLRRNAALVQ